VLAPALVAARRREEDEAKARLDQNRQQGLGF